MASETVIVASKMQLGLQLQLQAVQTVKERLADNSVRDAERYAKTGDIVVINGAAVDRNAPSDKQLVGGFALTYGVDKAFWDEWSRQNADFPPLKNGFIFAYERPASVTGEAKEKASLKTGGEPLDPSNLPDEFKRRVKAGVN